MIKAWSDCPVQIPISERATSITVTSYPTTCNSENYIYAVYAELTSCIDSCLVDMLNKIQAEINEQVVYGLWVFPGWMISITALCECV